jgi:hypothetical protein
MFDGFGVSFKKIMRSRVNWKKVDWEKEKRELEASGIKKGKRFVLSR